MHKNVSLKALHKMFQKCHNIWADSFFVKEKE